MYRYQLLKQRHRQQREQFNQNLNLRVHRALSWLDKAEQSSPDLDAQYIFLWIAFNSAYAHEIPTNNRTNEKQCFNNFFERITHLDKDQSLYNLVWTEFPSSVRLLLNNHYVFSPFWQYKSGGISENDWQESFNKCLRMLWRLSKLFHAWELGSRLASFSTHALLHKPSCSLLWKKHQIVVLLSLI